MYGWRKLHSKVRPRNLRQALQRHSLQPQISSKSKILVGFNDCTENVAPRKFPPDLLPPSAFTEVGELPIPFHCRRDESMRREGFVNIDKL